MYIYFRLLGMTLDATGTVSLWELSPPSLSTSDVRSLIARAEEWKDSRLPAKALAVVVLATQVPKSTRPELRPRLIPFAGCSESAQRAWSFGCWSIGLTETALCLPEAPAGALLL